ncbi:MAG TPA: hypothetical protein VIJ95_01865 [Hanamia sp.]
MRNHKCATADKMNNKPKYNPKIHHRRSIRLKGYDYSQSGLYFITICCQDMICRLGKIANGEMVLNELGTIAYNEWLKLPERFPNFELDLFQIMPNHIHGIVALVGAPLVGAQNDADYKNDAGIQNDVDIQNDTGAQNDAGTQWAAADIKRAGASPAPTTVGDIMGAYKSLVSNNCLEIYKSKNKMMGKFLQRNYYEHIIRNEQSYKTISNYIIYNSSNWKDDKFYRE